MHLANDCEYGLGGGWWKPVGLGRVIEAVGATGWGSWLHCRHFRNVEHDSHRKPPPQPPPVAGAVISKDAERCKRVAEALECGIVWVNCSQPCFCQVRRWRWLTRICGDARYFWPEQGAVVVVVGRWDGAGKPLVAHTAGAGGGYSSNNLKELLPFSHQRESLLSLFCGSPWGQSHQSSGGKL